MRLSEKSMKKYKCKLLTGFLLDRFNYFIFRRFHIHANLCTHPLPGSSSSSWRRSELLSSTLRNSRDNEMSGDDRSGREWRLRTGESWSLLAIRTPKRRAGWMRWEKEKRPRITFENKLRRGQTLLNRFSVEFVCSIKKPSQTFYFPPAVREDPEGNSAARGDGTSPRGVLPGGAGAGTPTKRDCRCSPCRHTEYAHWFPQFEPEL